MLIRYESEVHRYLFNISREAFRNDGKTDEQLHRGVFCDILMLSLRT